MDDPELLQAANDLQPFMPDFVAGLCIAEMHPPWYTTEFALSKALQTHAVIAGGGVLPSKEACRLALRNGLDVKGGVLFQERLDHPVRGHQDYVYLNVRLPSQPADYFCERRRRYVGWDGWAGGRRDYSMSVGSCRGGSG
jgi:hypothetical protein